MVIIKTLFMKKTLLKRISIFVVLFITLTNFQCKKETADKFCEVQRSTYLILSNKEGMIVYSNKYNRYAISFTVTTPNNIDSQVIGFVCGLSPELKTIGLRIIFSGTLKKFNTDENMTPEIAGQDLYFFETSQITKK